MPSSFLELTGNGSWNLVEVAHFFEPKVDLHILIESSSLDCFGPSYILKIFSAKRNCMCVVEMLKVFS